MNEVMTLDEAVAFLTPFAAKCWDARSDMVYGRENGQAGRALKVVLAALATPSSEPIAAEPTVAIPKRLVDFLMGAGELEGCHFGEMERGYGHRGRFWWRALLAAAMRSASSSALPLTGSEPSADAIAATGEGEGA